MRDGILVNKKRSKEIIKIHEPADMHREEAKIKDMRESEIEGCEFVDQFHFNRGIDEKRLQELEEKDELYTEDFDGLMYTNLPKLQAFLDMGDDR